MAIDFALPNDIVELRDRVPSARLVDGADEVHLTQICRHVLEAYRANGSCRQARVSICCSDGVCDP